MVDAAGCGTGLATGGAAAAVPLAAGGASSIYVAELSGGDAVSVLQFATTGGGSVSPSSTLPLNITSEASPRLTTDASGQLYSGTRDSVGIQTIKVYPTGASGSASPSRTITGPFPSPGSVESLTIDAAGQLYVLTNSSGASLSVFSPTANGVATPLRTIAGSLTGLYNPIGNDSAVALDAAGYLYVLCNNPGVTSVLVFAPGASGNVAPVRTLTVASYNALASSWAGLALDPEGNLYVSYPISVGQGAVAVFAPGANGAATPVRTLGGSTTALAQPYTLRIDSAGNLFVLSEDLSDNVSVEAFGPGASGNTPPALQFTSPALTATGFGGLAIR